MTDTEKHHKENHVDVKSGGYAVALTTTAFSLINGAHLSERVKDIASLSCNGGDPVVAVRVYLTDSYVVKGGLRGHTEFVDEPRSESVKVTEFTGTGVTLDSTASDGHTHTSCKDDERVLPEALSSSACDETEKSSPSVTREV